MRFRALREAGVIVAAATALLTVTATVPTLAAGATTAREAVSHVTLNKMTYTRDAHGDLIGHETVRLNLTSAPGSNITNSQTITQIRAAYLGWYLNPSQASGYGGARIEHFPYLGSGKYGISMAYSYHSPAIAQISPASPKAPSGFGDCLLHPLSAGHCWNNPTTWDWGFIFGQKGIPGESMWDRIRECKAGTVRNITTNVGAPVVARGLIWAGVGEAEASLSINPYGLLIGTFFTCSYAWLK